MVTPDGFPLAYEVMNGDTSDRSTLRDFLKQIENAYGDGWRDSEWDSGFAIIKLNN